MEEKAIKSILKISPYNAAVLYALFRHNKQVRSDGTPYIFHPVRVFLTLTNFYDKNQNDLLTAALLHDTIEDTTATEEDVKKIFGKNVKDIVKELTLPQGITHEAKGLYLSNKLPLFSDEALSIKFADRLDNVSSLNTVSPEKRHRYLNETAMILYNFSNSQREITTQQKELLTNLRNTLESYNPSIYIFKEEKTEKDL